MDTPDTTVPAVGCPPPWQAPDSSCPACYAELSADALFCGICGAPRHDDARLGQLILGRYLLVEAIGDGGMGTVYRAEQRVRGFVRSVAVKIMHEDVACSASIRARFARECEIVCGLQHPNTVRVFDFGELEDGSLAIVMELVEGETLAERIARGPIAFAEALAIIRQIAGSLAEAHAAGVVHRDLKPENVLLFERSGASAPGVKVLDFGVATAPHDGRSAAITFQGEVLGTPAYMSPEQISGAPLDARSDVYSLAVVAYEMLCGELPLEASSLNEWAQRHLFEEPAPLEAHPAGRAVPAAARAIVAQALEKDAADRPRTVLAFVRGLADAAPAQLGARPSALATARSDPGSSMPALPASRAPRRAALFAAAALAGIGLLGAGMLPAAARTAHKLDPGGKPSAVLAHCAPEQGADCATL